MAPAAVVTRGKAVPACRWHAVKEGVTGLVLPPRGGGRSSSGPDRRGRAGHNSRRSRAAGWCACRLCRWVMPIASASAASGGGVSRSRSMARTM